MAIARAVIGAISVALSGAAALEAANDLAFFISFSFLIMKRFGLLLGLLLPLHAYAVNYDLTGNKVSDDLVATVIYSALGIIIALLVFKIIDVMTPGHLGKQLTEEKNMSLAIVVGSLMLGICIIIAAAIAG
jgi:uncharacterized membrane protein YjfL (UPF0719 family)